MEPWFGRKSSPFRDTGDLVSDDFLNLGINIVTFHFCRRELSCPPSPCMWQRVQKRRSLEQLNRAIEVVQSRCASFLFHGTWRSQQCKLTLCYQRRWKDRYGMCSRLSSASSDRKRSCWGSQRLSDDLLAPTKPLSIQQHSIVHGMAASASYLQADKLKHTTPHVRHCCGL